MSSKLFVVIMAFIIGITALASAVELPQNALYFDDATYTVKYFVDGVEYFPNVEYEAQFRKIMGYPIDYETLNDAWDYEKKVAKYKKGDKITDFETPYRVGYNGYWDTELPETMGRTNYELNAVYEIGEYTLKFANGTIDVEYIFEGVLDGEDLEILLPEVQTPEILGEISGTYGDEIDMAQIPDLPRIDGYESIWDTEIPTTIPGRDITISVIYIPIDL